MISKELFKNLTNSEERLALAKVVDMANVCLKRHESVYSDFLDPVKAGKFYELLKYEREINIYIFGGYEGAERKMLGICPDYSELSYDEFPIDILSISYNAKYSREMAHRDFLGAILGLGIDRSRVGDIVINDNNAKVFISKEISQYVTANLEKVGQAKVTVDTCETFDSESGSAGQEIRMTVASLRLDAVVSAAFHISRSQSAGLIEGEKIFINWSMVNNTAKLLAQNDVITVRGLGRIKLKEVGGKTKKDRTTIIITKY